MRQEGAFLFAGHFFEVSVTHFSETPGELSKEKLSRKTRTKRPSELTL